MPSRIRFDSSVKTIGHFDPCDPVEFVRETMLHRADAEFAFKHGGPLTRKFILDLPVDSYEGWIFDVRIHNLKKGELPSIDAWHLDFLDFNKTETALNRRIIGVIGDCSLTRFLKQPVVITAEDDIDFAAWSNEIDAQEPEVYQLSNLEMVEYTAQTFHRAAPATHDGWRILFRAVESMKASNSLPENAITWNVGNADGSAAEPLRMR
jgi:hypothetical protein